MTAIYVLCAEYDIFIGQNKYASKKCWEGNSVQGQAGISRAYFSPYKGYLRDVCVMYSFILICCSGIQENTFTMTHNVVVCEQSNNQLLLICRNLFAVCYPLNPQLLNCTIYHINETNKVFRCFLLLLLVNNSYICCV